MRNVDVFFEELRGTFANICSFLSANMALLILLIIIVNVILVYLISKRLNSENIALYCSAAVNFNGLYLLVVLIFENRNIYYDSLWFYLNLISIVGVVNLVLRRNEEFKSY